MRVSGEGLNFGPESEADPVELAREAVSIFLVQEAAKEPPLLAILYDKVDPERPVVRFLSGSRPSEAHKGQGMVRVDFISVSTPEGIDTTTIVIDKQQFVLDSLRGAYRVDNHKEDPDEEAVVAAKILECVTPGHVLWTKYLTDIRSKEVFELYEKLKKEESSEASKLRDILAGIIATEAESFKSMPFADDPTRPTEEFLAGRVQKGPPGHVVNIAIRKLDLGDGVETITISVDGDQFVVTRDDISPADAQDKQLDEANLMAMQATLQRARWSAGLSESFAQQQFYLDAMLPDLD